jgi:hypothetical protein
MNNLKKLAFIKKIRINHQPYSGRVIGVLLSLLSPVLSLKFSQQLITNQPFTDFSDSSDSKNWKIYSYVNNMN